MNDRDGELLDAMRKLWMRSADDGAFVVLGRDGNYHVRRDGDVVRAGEWRVLSRCEMGERLWDFRIMPGELATDDGGALSLIVIEDFLTATRRRWKQYTPELPRRRPWKA